MTPLLVAPTPGAPHAAEGPRPGSQPRPVPADSPPAEWAPTLGPREQRTEASVRLLHCVRSQALPSDRAPNHGVSDLPPLEILDPPGDHSPLSPALQPPRLPCGPVTCPQSPAEPRPPGGWRSQPLLASPSLPARPPSAGRSFLPGLPHSEAGALLHQRGEQGIRTLTLV